MARVSELPEVPIDLPEVPTGWTARVPTLDDVPRLLELRAADQRPWTGSERIDEPAVESQAVGPASWTRSQAVMCDPDGRIRAWVVVHDRAAGRTMLYVYVDRDAPEADDIAAAAYHWAAERAVEMSRLRELEATRLDASPFAEDERQQGWLRQAGFERRRTWLHLSRPVDPTTDSAAALPPLREGVSIRRVTSHDNGLPVAADLQTVHRMLEESFQDHFNSYRESFPEFVQRLREDESHRWDHWWLAFVEPDDGGAPVPAGAVVCSILGADDSGAEGTYVEYIGVNRMARGRGVAKGLLYAVIADAAERGRNRVDLEVDADSPTQADQLYASLGWKLDFVTESWFRELTVGG